MRFKNQERKVVSKMMERRQTMSGYIENSQGQYWEKERRRIFIIFIWRGVK